MIKIIINFIKKSIFSVFLLYGFNVIMAPLSLIIPINIITVLTLSILGFPALLGFIIIILMIY